MTEILGAATAYVDELFALFENFTSDARQQWSEISGEGSLTDTIQAFVRAVDWTEPWLMALMCFHIMMLVVAVRTRKDNAIQIALFLAGLVGVYSAEKINIILDHNWKFFAGQPYFDRYGVFLSTVWSVPILLITTVILVNSLWTLVQLLVKWKRAELKYRARIERKKQE